MGGASKLIAAETGADWAQTGILGAVVLALVIAGTKRVWMFTWTHNDLMAGKDRELAAKDEQLKIERIQCERERGEKEEWKMMSLTQAGLLHETVERTTRVVERVVNGGG